ncbi:NAD(P)H-binding protein [Lactobacillus sp. PV034]|uniref:NAD(P)H-binding protein n=1 Tax=Lactobacillus sp. PV034 TaxID=2594495 RepID=UPI0022403EEA|nr:NAD(P)H-binding protein [Lactobacillus sp. PV034]QNQ80294.1 NAD-dependent epimerase/dehydratase family protein [Lactobacillus sp. PV034]
MIKNVLIVGANGQIARLVEDRLLKDGKDVHLTLFLRNAGRLVQLKDNKAVTIIDGDANNSEELREAIKDQDIVYVAFVDHGENAQVTKNIIKIMDKERVKRLISSNILGIYDEVPGEFGEYNRQMCFGGVVKSTDSVVQSATAIENSDLDYTILRIPWLNDRNEIKYTVTHKGEEYIGVSASRKSVADLIVKIINDPKLYEKESIGFANPDTQGASRPVY